jgi:hypothetical protein
MDEQDARRERHDYRLTRRHVGLRIPTLRDTDYYPPGPPPDRLASSPYDIGRGIIRWGAIAFGCWALVSGGMYLGWIMFRSSVLGPDLW